MFVQVQKVVGMDIHKPIVYKQLTQDIPSLLETQRIVWALGREFHPSPAVKVSPEGSKTFASVCRQGNFGIGIRRFVSLNGPPPQTRKVKPPNLAVLFKCEILEGILPVLLDARHQLFLIG
jgi:hypothetical protein